MSKVRIKHIFDKEGLLISMLDQLNRDIPGAYSIQNEKGRLIHEAGNQSNPAISLELTAGENVIAKVCGDEAITRQVHALMQVLVKKEVEKKQIGSEVLDLYREINLIYNFSEELAQHIHPDGIGKLALEEAIRILKTKEGVIFLLDESGGKPKILGSIGTFWDGFLQNDRKFNSLLENDKPAIFPPDEMKSMDPAYPYESSSAIFAPLKIKETTLGGLCLLGSDHYEFTAADLKFLTTIGIQSASAIESALLYEKQIEEAREREETMKAVQKMTSRFVPFEFLKSLGHKSLMDTAHGDHVENEVTVMFLDIRGYSTLAEKMTPEENFKFVNSFHSRMGPVVRKNNGFINQYLGDGFMAIFPNDANDALIAAIDVLDQLRIYNEERSQKVRDSIQVGIGMHTGPLIMGITGDEERWDAATISDTVNTAARIESLTKFYKCKIILSEETFGQLTNRQRFMLRSLGKVQVMGRESTLHIYECFDGDESEIRELKITTLPYFNEGIRSDETAQSFLGRISNLMMSESMPDWNGIEKMRHK
jgi:class 3 adenylate cyclase